MFRYPSGILAATLLFQTYPFLAADSGQPVFADGTSARLAQQEIVFHSPAANPNEGMPIGNGRMGTLVWTQGDAIAFQLNRVDNFTTNRFHGRDQIIHDGPDVYSNDPEKPSTDQLLSLGSLQVHFPGEQFGKGKQFTQRLSLADGRVTVHNQSQAGVIEAETFVAANEDVLTLIINDARRGAESPVLSLSLWRKPFMKQGNHTVSYTLSEREGKILLLHEAKEGKFHSRYAVAIGLAGRSGIVELHGAQEALLHVGKGKKPYFILAASASTLDGVTDVAGQALSALARTASKTRTVLVAAQGEWWQSFWSRSFVALHSEDGVADYLSHLYYLNLYLMASSSRGRFPTKFNNSLWLAEQDRRPWGAQYWLWNEEALYEPLLAANQVAPTDSFYRMYFDQLSLAKIAAQQRWGVGGAFFPETVSYDGPLELPEPIAREFRDIFLARSTADKLSPEARKYAYDSQLWAVNRSYAKYLLAGRYSFITHILSSGSELALQFWRRFEYTQDRDWLAQTAYPLMKETAQFYLEYCKLGPDGRLHIFPTNAHESFWGARDAITDLAAIRGLFPRCLRASEILGIDENLREQWRGFLEKLTPYPDGADPEAIRLQSTLGPGTWAAALYGEVPGRRNYEEVWTAPVYPFYAVAYGSSDAKTWSTALATYKVLPQRLLLAERDHSLVSADWGVPGHSRIALLSALMRQPDDAAKIIPEFAIANQPAAGGGTGDPEALGITASAIQAALLQSTNGVMEVFPAWPEKWDAQFELLTPGAFLISSSRQHGQVEFVSIKARFATTCKVVNPWNAPVYIRGKGTKDRQAQSSVIEIPMKAGQMVVLTKAEAPPPAFPFRPMLQPASFPLKLSVTGSDGKVYASRLGN
jgi:hypothetical protein